MSELKNELVDVIQEFRKVLSGVSEVRVRGSSWDSEAWVWGVDRCRRCSRFGVSWVVEGSSVGVAAGLFDGLSGSMYSLLRVVPVSEVLERVKEKDCTNYVDCALVFRPLVLSLDDLVKELVWRLEILYDGRYGGVIEKLKAIRERLGKLVEDVFECEEAWEPKALGTVPDNWVVLNWRPVLGKVSFDEPARLKGELISRYRFLKELGEATRYWSVVVERLLRGLGGEVGSGFEFVFPCEPRTKLERLRYWKKVCVRKVESVRQSRNFVDIELGKIVKCFDLDFEPEIRKIRWSLLEPAVSVCGSTKAVFEDF